jgi:hypothetical protein
LGIGTAAVREGLLCFWIEKYPEGMRLVYIIILYNLQFIILRFPKHSEDLSIMDSFLDVFLVGPNIKNASSAKPIYIATTLKVNR